jgi:hypothetical protein
MNRHCRLGWLCTRCTASHEREQAGEGGIVEAVSGGEWCREVLILRWHLWFRPPLAFST